MSRQDRQHGHARSDAGAETDTDRGVDRPVTSDHTSNREVVRRLRSAGGRGRRLDPETDRVVSRVVGQPVPGLRVHTGGDADQLTEAFDVPAFTAASHTFLHRRVGSPTSAAGREVLAHEAAHVVQGRANERTRSIPATARPHHSAAAEQAADVAGRRARGAVDAASAAPAPPAVRVPSWAVLGFGAIEHKTLGDLGAGGSRIPGDLSTGPDYDLGAGFRLTHGDIVMLSGDLFDPRDGAVGPDGTSDSLFDLANRPSTNPGQQVGTWDEVIFALHHEAPGDPRFSSSPSAQYPTGGPWAGLTFSAEVQTRVKSRYLRLAAQNREHFVAPEGHGGALAGLGSSAGGSYRALHEGALLAAFSAGQSGDKPDVAMAREAAAQHFLTDAFASGHLRVPRVSIVQHWEKIYPLFFQNFKRAIANAMAIHINAETTNLATIWGNVQEISAGVLEEVEKQMEGVPPMGFGDVVGLVAHDFENEVGIDVTNELGETWTTFGDGSLDAAEPGNRTREMTQLAVRLGIEDVENAYRFGTTGPGTPAAADIFAAVRSATAPPASAAANYGPEQVVPTAAAHVPELEAQPTTFDQLWEQKIRPDNDVTYGTRIEEGIASGELGKTLESKADSMDATKEVWDEVWGQPIYAGTIEPKKAYLEGFLAPLRANTRRELQAIVDFNPARGQAYHNRDDAIMEEMGAASEDELEGLSLNQRADRVRELIGGWTSGAEGEAVIDLFNTASPGDRRRLYQLVEGHAWTGDWRRGILTADDDIWNALYRGQLTRLAAIIEGSTEK